jgi:hypothetical protein
MKNKKRRTKEEMRIKSQEKCIEVKAR